MPMGGIIRIRFDLHIIIEYQIKKENCKKTESRTKHIAHQTDDIITQCGPLLSDFIAQSFNCILLVRYALRTKFMTNCFWFFLFVGLVSILAVSVLVRCCICTVE